MMDPGYLLQEAETKSLLAGLRSLHGWMVAQAKINPPPHTEVEHQVKEVKEDETIHCTTWLMIVRRKM